MTRFFATMPATVQARAVAGMSLLAIPEDRPAVVLSLTVFEGTYSTVRLASVSNLDSVRTYTIGDGQLTQSLSKRLGEVRKDLIILPPVEWARSGHGLGARGPITAVVALLVITLALLTGMTVFAALAIPLAAVAGALTWHLLRRRQPTRILTAGDLRIDGSNVVEYATARSLGERPDARTETQRREAIAARIDAVRTGYVDLRDDIVYRIENPALFDAASPATNAFEVTLVRADVDPGSLTIDEYDALAADLEIAYAVARDNAETLGMGHLPEGAVEDARRASKAARLARRATSDGEREAALAQVVRILESLALHYLPAPATARRQLTTGPDQSSETAASDV